jgi:hypothetical protein
MSDSAGDMTGRRGPVEPGITPDQDLGVGPEAEIRAREPGGRTGARMDEPASIGHLLSQLVDDVAVLVRKELALATSEVSNSIDRAKAGAGSAVGGGAVLYAGVLFLLLAATFGLAEVVPLWGAALIVGGVVTLIGFIMYRSGKSKMQAQSFVPDRATRSVRKDADMIERQKP